MRDLASHIVTRPAISPAAAVADNTPLVSSIINLAGFDKAMFSILIGAVADADATFTVLLEHGDAANLSDAAAVPDSQLTGTELAAGFKFDSDNSTRKLGYVGPKQYLRLTITPVNNSGNAFIAAEVILSSARYQLAI